MLLDYLNEKCGTNIKVGQEFRFEVSHTKRKFTEDGRLLFLCIDTELNGYWQEDPTKYNALLNAKIIPFNDDIKRLVEYHNEQMGDDDVLIEGDELVYDSGWSIPLDYEKFLKQCKIDYFCYIENNMSFDNESLDYIKKWADALKGLIALDKQIKGGRD